MSNPTHTNAKPSHRTAKPPYGKLSGDSSGLKTLGMLGLLLSGNQRKMLRVVMAAYLLCRCKHLCILIFRVVVYPRLGTEPANVRSLAVG